MRNFLHNAYHFFGMIQKISVHNINHTPPFIIPKALEDLATGENSIKRIFLGLVLIQLGITTKDELFPRRLHQFSSDSVINGLVLPELEPSYDLSNFTENVTELMLFQRSYSYDQIRDTFSLATKNFRNLARVFFSRGYFCSKNKCRTQMCPEILSSASLAPASTIISQIDKYSPHHLVSKRRNDLFQMKELGSAAFPSIEKIMQYPYSQHFTTNCSQELEDFISILKDFTHRSSLFGKSPIHEFNSTLCDTYEGFKACLSNLKI